jgi:hypothetical protein
MALKNLLSGLVDNLSEQDPEQLRKDYAAYLVPDETISTGFKMIRDVMIITDKRILFFDKQGATGKKMRVDSIFLASITHVTIETADLGIDDSELTITYMTTPFMASHNPSFASKTFEFPKKYNIAGLYVLFEDLALKNHENINRQIR